MIRRGLTAGERALAASMFGDAIDYDGVTLNLRKWWPFQPRRVTMAPDGHMWFHPASGAYCDDFACASLAAQSLFIHEMTHVAQTAKGGKWYLPLMRHPFCRYDYEIVPGRPFERYGLEQQAEIVRHAFMLRQGAVLPGKPGLEVYEALLPYSGRSPRC